MTVKIAALTLASFAAAGAFYSLLRAQETPMLSVWDGVYTNEQAERGRSLYREHCEDCHGIALEGDVESAPLTGGVFQTNWNSVPLGKLYQRIRRDMPADKPGSLSPETLRCGSGSHPEGQRISARRCGAGAQCGFSESDSFRLGQAREEEMT